MKKNRFDKKSFIILTIGKPTNDIYFGEKNSAGAVEPAVEI